MKDIKDLTDSLKRLVFTAVNKKWRREKSLEITKNKRPDLIEKEENKM